MTEQATPEPISEQAPADAASSSSSPAGASPEGTSPPAQSLHGDADPVTAGNVWVAAAKSEHPGDHIPAPEGWENPPALELHGHTVPSDRGVWVPSDGGVGGPYDLARTEHTPPEGWENPPAREMHGSVTPAA